MFNTDVSPNVPTTLSSTPPTSVSGPPNVRLGSMVIHSPELAQATVQVMAAPNFLLTLILMSRCVFMYVLKDFIFKTSQATGHVFKLVWQLTSLTM